MERAPVHRRTGSARRGLALGASIPLAFLISACDIPTELPTWDTTWIVPGETTTIGTSSFLPSTISEPAGANAFVLTLAPVTLSRTLGQMCGSLCVVANGQTAPKPPFGSSLTSSINLPDEVISAALSTGRVQLKLQHDFGFDPIRPSSTARGYVLVSVASGGTLLARDSIPGEHVAFPAGVALIRDLALPAATLSGPIAVEVEIASPLGDPVRINTAQTFSLTATPANLQVTRAQVHVTNRSVSSQPTELDVDKFDSAITQRVRSGALMLSLENPFSVSGALQLRIAANGTVLTRQIALAAGQTSARADFDEQEMRTILASRPVTLSVVGTVSAPSGGTAVLPAQAVTIRSRLELILAVREN
jgi:hypothetical protein